MDHIEKIESGGTLLGLIIRQEREASETEFYTDGQLPLQLGIFAHDAGFEEPLHTHREINRELTQTHQVVHLTEGVLNVSFKTLNGDCIMVKRVGEGDTLLLGDGAHSIEILEPVQGITVKQGPYQGEAMDKMFLECDEE